MKEVEEGRNMAEVSKTSCSFSQIPPPSCYSQLLVKIGVGGSQLTDP